MYNYLSNVDRGADPSWNFWNNDACVQSSSFVVDTVDTGMKHVDKPTVEVWPLTHRLRFLSECQRASIVSSIV